MATKGPQPYPLTATIDASQEGTVEAVARTRVPAELMSAIREAATAAGQRPSAFMREAITQELRRRGFWPPSREPSTP